MKPIFYLTIIATLLLTSCQKETPIIKKKGSFDLEKINFEENIDTLYSLSQASEGGIPYHQSREGIMSDSLLEYRIIPQKPFALCYRSVNTDSITRFGNTYFDIVYTLTNFERQAMGYYAETRSGKIGNPDIRAGFLHYMEKKYGAPEFVETQDTWKTCYYQWHLNDRTIQLITSNGFTSAGDIYLNGNYTKMELLIIANKALDTIHQAHIFERETDTNRVVKIFVKDKFVLQNWVTKEYSDILNRW